MRRRTDDGPNGGHKGTQKNLLEFGLLVCIAREGSELRSVGKFPRIIVQCDCREQAKGQNYMVSSIRLHQRHAMAGGNQNSELVFSFYLTKAMPLPSCVSPPHTMQNTMLISVPLPLLHWALVHLHHTTRATALCDLYLQCCCHTLHCLCLWRMNSLLTAVAQSETSSYPFSTNHTILLSS